MSDDHFHDVYSEQFYLNHTQEPHFSQTRAVGRAIATALLPESVIDLGCGVGAMLLGVRDVVPRCRVVGVESPTGIDRMDRSGAMRLPREFYVGADLREVPTGDLMSHLLERGQYSVAVSAEVAEHLPPESAGTHVNTLCVLSNTVVLSAAYPGQGGDQHINERPWTYWRDLFAERGFAFDEPTTRGLIDLFRDEATQPWGYAKNTRVYRYARG